MVNNFFKPICYLDPEALVFRNILVNFFYLKDFKPIQNGPYLRHRLLISDGKFKSTSTMIGTQLNEMIGKEITANAVFRVDRYIVNTVQEVKKVGKFKILVSY